MRRRAFACLALMIAATVPAAAEQTRSTKSAAPPRPAPSAASPKLAVMVTLQLKSPRLGEVVAALGKRYSIPILADSYLEEGAIPELNLNGVPVDKALSQVAERFQRTVEWVGPVAVLRHKQWFDYPKRDQQYLAYLGGKAPEPGPVRVQAVDTEKDTKPMGVPARRPQYALPPAHVSVVALRTPLATVLQEFSAVSQCPTTVAAPLQERRIDAYLGRITPGEFADALAYLLNASQKVAIEQNPAQVEREQLIQEEAHDTRGADHKLSDELMPEILKVLNETQRAAMERKEEVALPLTSLPASLRGPVAEYMKMRIINKNPALIKEGIAGIDLSRLNQFSIVILPAPSQVLGVDGFLTDGIKVGF